MPDDPMPVSAGSAHRTFTSIAESTLQEMVLDGRLPPGERLNEVALSASLEISRGPIREAIARLTSRGLLTSVSHRGAYVRSFGRRELEDLYQLRIALETYAVRVGARRATDDEIHELEQLLDATTRLLDDENVTRYPSDLDFHERLVALAHNPALHTAFEGALVQITLARSRSSSDPDRARAALAEHHSVLTRLVRRDGRGAAARLERHLQEALANAVAVLDLD